MSIPNTLERDQVCHCAHRTVVKARADKPWLNELAELSPRHHDDSCPLFNDDSDSRSGNGDYDAYEGDRSHSIY